MMDVLDYCDIFLNEVNCRSTPKLLIKQYGVLEATALTIIDDVLRKVYKYEGKTTVNIADIGLWYELCISKEEEEQVYKKLTRNKLIEYTNLEDHIKLTDSSKLAYFTMRY